jgi:O-methyltransferase
MALGNRAEYLLFLWRLGYLWNEVGDKKRTKLSWMRFGQLASFAQTVVREKVPGDFVEFGTWRGGSLCLVAHLWEKMGQHRTLWGFDSFEGLPASSSARDGAALRPGMFGNTDFDEVRAFFTGKGLSSVRLVKGWFQDTLPQLEGHRFALCHIDVDLHDSVKLVLERAYPRMAPGGIVIIDDYGHPHCNGATVATEEFFVGRKERIQKIPGIDGSCWVRCGF